jgi:hypothetical protein
MWLEALSCSVLLKFIKGQEHVNANSQSVLMSVRRIISDDALPRLYQHREGVQH